MVDATPLDAASAGVQRLFLATPPDLIVCGVTQGLNLARLAVHSGPVVSALRAALPTRVRRLLSGAETAGGGRLPRGGAPGAAVARAVAGRRQPAGSRRGRRPPQSQRAAGLQRPGSVGPAGPPLLPAGRLPARH